MAELGKLSGMFLIPLKLCVFIIGGFLVFSFIADLSYFINNKKCTFDVNGIATLLSRPASDKLIKKFPDVVFHEPAILTFRLLLIRISVIGLLGAVTVIQLILGMRLITFVQFIMATTLAGLYICSDICLLYHYVKGNILEANPNYFKKTVINLPFISPIHWPVSFYYNFLSKNTLHLYILYNLINIYYSCYLVEKYGGSGWENLSYEELPGWEKYVEEQSKLNKQKQIIYNLDKTQRPLEVDRELIENLMRQLPGVMATQDHAKEEASPV